MAPIHDGKIEIDGYNITEIGLDVLRNRLALVPQDTNLFLGTLRENLYASQFSTPHDVFMLFGQGPSKAPN